MSDRRPKLPSPALVLSVLALVVAMSGTAVAIKKNSVGPRQLQPNAVRGQHVERNALRSKHVRRNAIKGRHVRADKLKTTHLKDGQGVAGIDVIDGSLGAADLAPNSVGGAKVIDDSLTGADIDESTLAGLDSPAGPAGGDLAGTYPNPTIAPGAVGTAKLDDLAVTTAKVAANAIGSGKVADDALTGADIDESTLGKVGNADTLDGSDSTDFLGAAQEAAGDVAGPFSNLQIEPQAVDSAEIAGGAIGTPEIRANGVGSSEIQSGAVGADEIDKDAVGANEADLNAVQARVTASCAAGSSISSIDAGGNVSCESHPGGREVATTSSAYDASDLKNATATCPAGKQAVGGGGRVSTLEAPVLSYSSVANIAIQTSAPSGNASWVAAADNTDDDGIDWRLEAYAVCVDLS